MIQTEEKLQPVVHFPSELDSQDFYGLLFGYFHSSSNQYNIVDYGLDDDSRSLPTGVAIIGKIIKSIDEVRTLEPPMLIGIRESGNLKFQADGIDCKKSPYDFVLNAFSRNLGILETPVMLKKTAIICGCGSVGSLVSLELARAGVGNFFLVDHDTLAYNNLCRHQCGLPDVGDYKVNAVKSRILQINSKAKVMTSSTILEEVPPPVFDNICNPDCVIVGCADNREGDIYASKVSANYRIPMVSIGLWERATAGEIFYSIPPDMPCYTCVFEDMLATDAGRISTSRRIYTAEEDLSSIRFEPGISADISFVSLIAVKLIIDILNRDTSGYNPKLLNNLSQLTLVCNTNDSRLGGKQLEIFSYPLQVTKSIKVEFRKPCPPCKFL